MNKRKNVLLLTALAVVPFALQLSACGEKFDTCENTLTCGDGDASGGTDSTGGTSGTGGEGDGDTGGSGGGTEEGCSPACTGEMVCDLASKQCVACVKSDDCKGADTYCDTDTNLCVECLETPQCTDAAASVCNEGACEQCQGPEDCAHIEDKGLCDEGTCVECTSEADCDGKVCDPDTRSCTEIDAGEDFACEPCQYDAQCAPGHVCVEMSYSDPAEGIVGSFCLWERDAQGLNAPKGTCGVNSRPFPSPASVTTVNGKSTTVCQPTTTTCIAILQHRTTVSGCDAPGDDAACGAETFNDGRCRENASNEPKCTYPCLGLEDCAAGATCPATGDRVCSL